MYTMTARRAYHNKKKDAKERNIAFLLTFKEYYDWFKSHGIDKNIPQVNDKNAKCMCRKNDIGPYTLDNIYLDTMSNNSKLANKINRDNGLYSSKHLCKSIIVNGVKYPSITEAYNVLGIKGKRLRYCARNPEQGKTKYNLEVIYAD